MKIQYLAVIFILIIMPITIVFSEYIDNQITTVKTENSYNAKLLNSTYDAIKAYQLNTVNNAESDRPTSKVDDIEAAVTTFFNSLVTSFGYDGYDSSVMNDYVPAVVFCMYDGYYMYSPFVNTLTGIADTDDYEVPDDYDEDANDYISVDSDYEDGSVLHALKPYVYYTCEYAGTNANGEKYDIVITYTLDNFITIDGVIDGENVYDSGYLVDGITKGKDGDDNDTYTYDGKTYSSTSTERQTEYLGAKEYLYTKIDGTKFYFSGDTKITRVDDIEDDDYIFYIDSSGNETMQGAKYGQCTDAQKLEFEAYVEAMINNIDGYVYYKEAYEFTNRVRNEYGLSKLKVGDAVDSQGYSFDQNADTYIFGSSVDIADSDDYIQNSNSDFNEHRMQVIKNVIKTNLTTAISAFGKYADSSTEYIMPEISDTDWELITNNVCIATFLQGMSIGGKVYNSYSVVANNLTKEYVDENDIYIAVSDSSSGSKTYTYYRANDNTLLQLGENQEISSGVLKLDFERRVYTADGTTTYYYPKSYKSGDSIVPYLGSYTSIIGSTTLNSISTTDMYRYMAGITASLKDTYYQALGRERIQAYNVQNGLKESYTVQTEDVDDDDKILGNYNSLTYNYSTNNGVEEVTVLNWWYLRYYYDIDTMKAHISTTDYDDETEPEEEEQEEEEPEIEEDEDSEGEETGGEEETGGVEEEQEEEPETTYTLTIDSNGGTWRGSTSYEGKAGDTVTISSTPTGASYSVIFSYSSNTKRKTVYETFTEWTLTGSGTFNGTMFVFGEGDATLTANYSAATITLLSRDDFGLGQSLLEGSLAWYTNSSYTNIFGYAGNTYTVTKSITLYGKWVSTSGSTS